MSVTNEITGQLLEAVDHDTAKVDEIFKAYAHSKGPLYIGLARATASLKEQFHALSEDFKKAKNDHRKLQEQSKSSTKDLDRLRQSQKRCADDVAILDKKLKGKKALLDQAEALGGLEFDIEQLTKLRNLLSQIAASEGVKSQEAIALFFDEVDLFENIFSLEMEEKRAKRSLMQAKAEAKRWNSEAKLAEIKAKSRKASIDLADNLLSRGVKEGDLRHWVGILSQAKVPLEKLAKGLEEFSTLEKLTRDRRKRSDTLKSELARLERQVKALKQEEAETHSAIRTVREKAVEEIRRSGEEALAQVRQMNQNVTTNIGELGIMVQEFGGLREELGDLRGEATIARALRRFDPELWGQIPSHDMAMLFVAVLAWAQNKGFNPVLTPPEGIQGSAYLSSFTRVRFADLVKWAATALMTEEIRVPIKTPHSQHVPSQSLGNP